jgi:hypothetical protein
MSDTQFDTAAYLNNKAAQLNATGFQGRNDWSPTQVATAMADAGLTPAQHAAQYAATEGVSTTAANTWNPPSTDKAALEAQKQADLDKKKNTDFTSLISSVNTGTNVARNIAPQETVSGQLTGLIAGDSKYIQSAKASGMATANERGLLNSTMAAGTAEKAAIDAAAPIAAQDASTYAASGLSSQNANQEQAQSQLNAIFKSISDAQSLYNGMQLQEQKGQIDSGLQAQQGKITSDLQAQKDAAYASLSLTMKNIDSNIDVMKIASADRSSYVQSMSQVMQNYQNAYTSIQTTPDSTINQTSKMQSLASLNDIYRANLVSMTNLYGYDVNWGATAAG